MRLKLVSFNVYDDNSEIDRVASFIENQVSADIICLQEVSVKLWGRLQEIDAYNVIRTDRAYRVIRQSLQTKRFLVIMINRRFRFSGGRHGYFKTRRPIGMLVQFVQYLQGKDAYGYQYVDVSFGFDGHRQCAVRICNAHLPNAVSPGHRLHYVDQMMKACSSHRGPMKRIFMGDLNIISQHLDCKRSRWYRKILHYIMSVVLGGWHILMRSWNRELFINEYDAFKDLVDVKGYMDVLDRTVTHPTTGCQLDYVLVSKNTHIHNASTHEDQLGSDHCPIITEIEI